MLAFSLIFILICDKDHIYGLTLWFQFLIVDNKKLLDSSWRGQSVATDCMKGKFATLVFALFLENFYNFPCNRCVPVQRSKIKYKEEILDPVLKLDSRLYSFCFF